jgi:hypothetical protein
MWPATLEAASAYMIERLCDCVCVYVCVCVFVCVSAPKP